jgi:hypothetical protein
MQQGYGNHPAQHEKLTLGEIDNAGGVVDNIKAYGHNGINDAIRDPGEEILEKKRKFHS